MDIKRVRNLLARGHSIREVGRYYGCSYGKVYKFTVDNIPDYKALMMTDREVAAKIDRAYKNMFGETDEVF